MKDKYIIFDLDDTLMYEIEYLESAYNEIAGLLDKENPEELYDRMMSWYYDKQDVFALLEEEYSYAKIELLNIYRNHMPAIKIGEDAEEVLNYFRDNSYKLGLITDGRSVTQRNKLKALNIEDFFERIVVSEEFGSTKPDVRNYQVFMENEQLEYFYIGDNPGKDFIAPNTLGWVTIALKDAGKNIHQQDFSASPEHQPKYIVNNLKEILDYIK